MYNYAIEVLKTQLALDMKIYSIRGKSVRILIKAIEVLRKEGEKWVNL